MKHVVAKKYDKKIILILCLIFYGFFFFFDGVSIAADSASYINMSISREPVYPLFLAAMRFIFGEAIYLNIVVFLQCILAAMATFWMTSNIRDLYKINWFITIVVMSIQFGITLLNRFIALRSVSYENSIQTEGIAISLYSIWVTEIIRYLFKRQRRDLIWVYLIAVILICTRKQMLLTLPVIAIFMFFVHCVPKVSIKKILFIFCSIIAAFLSTVFISKAYNFLYRGDFVGYTDSSNTVFTNMLYAADEEDIKLVKDVNFQKLYKQIYYKLDEQKLNYKYAPQGILNLETHYSECYDQIAITTVQPIIKQYVRDLGIENETQISMGADQIRTTILKDVLINNLPQMSKVYFSSVIHGYILTIAKQHPLLNIYALACYLLYIVMTVILIRKRGLTDIVKLSLLSGFLVTINVTLTAAFIFCQTRYMIYNMALCYITAVLLIKEVYDLLPHNLIQFIKFGLVGASNTLISYSIYYFALVAGLHYQLGNLIAYIITVFISFLINGNWVFKKQDNEARGFWIPLLKVYISYGLTSLVLNSILLYIQIDLFGMKEEIAPIINLVITIPLNFLLNKYWAFGKKVERQKQD